MQDTGTISKIRKLGGGGGHDGHRSSIFATCGSSKGEGEVKTTRGNVKGGMTSLEVRGEGQRWERRRRGERRSSQAERRTNKAEFGQYFEGFNGAQWDHYQRLCKTHGIENPTQWSIMPKD